MFPLQMSSQSVSERIQCRKVMNFGRVSSHRRLRTDWEGVLLLGSTKATQRQDIKRAITLADTLKKEK